MLNDNLRNVQAGWLRLEEDRVRRFIAAQPEVAGRVGRLSIGYPTSGQGISNGIAFLSADIDSGRGMEQRELVVRYAPGATLLKQKTFSDEYLTMKSVEAAGIPAPKMLWLDAEGDGLGAKGYIMERIFGDIPASSMFSAGLLAEAEAETRKALMLEAVGFHGRVRRAAVGPERVPHLVTRGSGATPVEREVNWWLEETRQNLPDGNDMLRRLRSAAAWLRAHQPALRPATLVHGDAQLCNLIYRDGKVIAALDWELAYLGHGEVDLAVAIWLTRLQQMAVPDLQGVPSEAEFITRYEDESGAPVEHYAYMKLLQLYKLCSVLTASAPTMPSFEQFWELNWSELEKIWSECRGEYGG